MIIICMILAISLTALCLIFINYILSKKLKFKSRSHISFILIIVGLLIFPLSYILTIQIAIRLFMLL